MSCEWSAKLDRYVDSELTDSELQEIQAHLLTCASCASGALSRLQLKRMTRAAAGQRFRPRPEFRLKVERSLGTARASAWTRLGVPAFAALAAVALLLLSFALQTQYSRDREQALRELADLHVSTLASSNPVDVLSSDRHTVKPWFQGKLPFTFNLPDFENTPFRLIGGRMAYFQQSPGAQLLVGIGKHEISVFIFQDRGPVSQLSSGNSANRLTFNSEIWTAGGLRYVALGDANGTDIRQLRELLKPAEKATRAAGDTSK